jgi:uncharacterized protein (DUF305 family)
MLKLANYLLRGSVGLLLAGGLLGSCRDRSDETADVHTPGAPSTMMAALHTMAEHSNALPQGTNLDLYYARLMRENHRAAVSMSALELQRGKDPVLRAIAADIHQAHQQLIPGLDSAIARILALPPDFPAHTPRAERLSELLADATAGLHPAAHRNLARAEGDTAPRNQRAQQALEEGGTGDIDRDYAALLVPHHENSITLARAELELGRDEALQRAAYLVLRDQQREIELVQAWLVQHPAKAKP